MIRKMMRALCLVVALVLALPLAAMADTQHTLKIIPGAELASEEIAGRGIAQADCGRKRERRGNAGGQRHGCGYRGASRG